MAENLEEVVEPFYQRAAEAEERLAKLEALLGSKKDDFDTEKSSSRERELQSKLEIAQAELKSEQEKASKEIKKLEYRIVHLVRALRAADSKLTILAKEQGC